MNDALKKAQAKYEQKNKRYVVKCLLVEDADIISKLETVDNKTNYIKELIRADIAKN